MCAPTPHRLHTHTCVLTRADVADSATVPTGGASEYYGYLADVPDELMITDVDLTVVADTTEANIPNKVKNCLAGIGTAPYEDSGWDLQASAAANERGRIHARPHTWHGSLSAGIGPRDSRREGHAR